MDKEIEYLKKEIEQLKQQQNNFNHKICDILEKTLEKHAQKSMEPHHLSLRQEVNTLLQGILMPSLKNKILDGIATTIANGIVAAIFATVYAIVYKYKPH